MHGNNFLLFLILKNSSVQTVPLHTSSVFFKCFVCRSWVPSTGSSGGEQGSAEWKVLHLAHPRDEDAAELRKRHGLHAVVLSPNCVAEYQEYLIIVNYVVRSYRLVERRWTLRWFQPLQEISWRDWNEPSEGSRALILEQPCCGTFSAVSTPNCVREYSCFSTHRHLQKYR